MQFSPSQIRRCDANHDVGTVRMGNDPKISVLNEFGCISSGHVKTA